MPHVVNLLRLTYFIPLFRVAEADASALAALIIGPALAYCPLSAGMASEATCNNDIQHRLLGDAPSKSLSQ